MESNATPGALSAAERADREARLEAKHKEFIRSIATSRSLPSQQSSTAGAGGTTNQKVRVAEDHEAERLLRMKLAAEEAARAKVAQVLHDEKVRALEGKQNKKKAKRLKCAASKKSSGPSNKKQPAGSGSDDSGSSSSSE